MRDSPSADDDKHLQTSYFDDKDVPDEQGILEEQGVPDEQGVPEEEGRPEEQDVPEDQDGEKKKVTYSLESSIEEGNV